MLCIHLEENDCFAAWVSSKDVGLGPADGPETKGIKYILVNISCKWQDLVSIILSWLGIH